MHSSGRHVLADHVEWSGWSPHGHLGHLCEEVDLLGKSDILQCNCTYLQRRCFQNPFSLPPAKQVLSILPSQTYTISTGLVLIFFFFSSQMFTLPVDRDKTNPHFLPPFCLPESVTPLYPWYTFKSNIKCTLKCRQRFSCVLVRDQAGQDCAIQLRRFTEQALISALVQNHRFIESFRRPSRSSNPGNNLTCWIPSVNDLP